MEKLILAVATSVEGKEEKISQRLLAEGFRKGDFEVVETQDLKKKIEEHNPILAILFGKEPLQEALGREDLEKIRGKPHNHPGEWVIYMPTYDPIGIEAAGEKKTELLKKDLAQSKEIFDKAFRTDRQY